VAAQNSVSTKPGSPERTCIGCRRREPQEQLIRLICTTTDAGERRVVVDAQRRMGGRGAWLHPGTECLALAQRKRAFARAFRTAVVSDGLDQDPALHSVPATAERSAGATVQIESGSEI